MEQLLPIAADLGCSMIGLAHAFVLSHPAVTSSIMGVRTMEQLAGQLDAPRRLPAGVLDRLDELVGPGTQVSPDWQTPDHYHRRVGRRRTDERGAAGGRIDGVADAAGWRR